MIKHSIVRCIAACTTLMLPACSTGPFSGAAAMRIDVEVYKGPLSLEPEIQLGELRGYLAEAYNGLIHTNTFTLAVAEIRHVDQKTDVKDWCIDKQEDFFFNRNARFDCSLLQSISFDTLQLLQKLEQALDTFTVTKNDQNSSSEKDMPPLDSFSAYQQRNRRYISKSYNFKDYFNGDPITIRERIRNTLELANVAAASMQSAAFRHTTAQTTGPSLNNKVRIALTHFIVTASEYSNQINSRADALMKQFDYWGRDRRELPLSVHLREAEPTDFMHLYKWMDATHNSFLNYFIVGSGTVDDRIKIVEILYGDHFWSKINTVHASGRGKTQMAFVKDETGNWNLKGYDNDPSDLLDAYTKVAKTALDGVVNVAMRLAQDGASGGGAEVAHQLLALADQTALAKNTKTAQPKGVLSLDHLRGRIGGQLNSAQIQGDITKDNDLMGEVNSAKTALETATKAGKTSEADQARSDLDKASIELQKHRKEAVNRWAALVDDHSNLVDMLGSTIKKK